MQFINCEILPKDGFMYVFDKLKIIQSVLEVSIPELMIILLKKKINDYPHDFEATKIEVEAIITKIKTRALQTMEPT